MGWERLPVDLHTPDAKSPYGTVDIETRGPYWDKPIRLTSRPDSPSSATTTSMVGSASFSWVNNFSISYLEKSDWQIHISRGDWATRSKKHIPISLSCFSDSLSNADSLRGVRRSEIRYRDHVPGVLPFADVKATGLSRVYETRKRKYGIGSQTISRINAVVDLELEIEQGELFGLLGPNGAGKTTTVKMLCTLLTPTRGNASIRGLDIVKDANKVRKIVNMVAGGERMLYYRLTGRENLRYFAELYDVPSSFVRKRVQQVLDLVGLADRADDEVEKYSKGMKQRLQIARGMINDPQVLFLDEPTLGLDVDIAKDLRAFIRKQLVEEQGKTALLTTHYLAEAEEMCDRVSFIFKGKIVSTGTPAELSRLIVPTITAELILSDVKDADIQQFASDTGSKVKSIEVVEDDPSKSKKRVLIENASEDTIRAVFEHFHGRGARVVSAALKQPNLEDAYLELVRTQAKPS